MKPTPQDVAVHLGIPYVPGDVRLENATAASTTWVEKRRSWTDPVLLWDEPDVVLGAITYAGLLYQSRSAPQGFDGYSDLGTYTEDVGQSMVQIHRPVSYTHLRAHET